MIKKSEAKCTAIIKTFLRDDYFFVCVDSLIKTYPSIKILTADSGNDSKEKKAFIKKHKLDYTKLPFDSGICVGRNTLIKKVETEYTLVGDDDFKYTDRAMVEEMITFLDNNPELDLIGGRVFEGGVIRNYQGFMSYSGRQVNYTPLDLNKEFLKDKKSGLRYLPCDLTFNFFVARTKSLRSVLWPEEIKVRYEHTAFFLDFMKAGYKVAFTPDAIVDHKPNGIKNSNEYMPYRNRAIDKELFFKRYDIHTIKEFNGSISTDEEFPSGYDNVSFIIKTLKRPACLEKLLFSIVKDYPRAKITIADDDIKFNKQYYKDLWERLMAKGLKNKPTAYNRPFDSGLSACRNFLIDNTDGDYILLLDDDFIFTEKTRIMKMKEILENNPKIGIVGGTVKNDEQETHFECVLEKEGDTLYQRPDGDDWKDCKGIPYKLTGCVLNFAMMRRKIFNDIRWDDKIKIKGEHTDFYLRLKDTKWKVAFCPEVSIRHEHISTGEYREMRMRDDFFLMMMQKHGLTKYTYLNGRTFEVKDGKMINYKQEKPITIKTI